MTNSQLYTTDESQEVGPFPAGGHNAQINSCVQKHNKHKTEKNIKGPQKRSIALERSVKYFTVGFKQVSRRQPTLNSDVDQDTYIFGLHERPLTPSLFHLSLSRAVQLEICCRILKTQHLDSNSNSCLKKECKMIISSVC